MSKYTREEQIQIVEWAMHLTATIESEKLQIENLNDSEFKAKPLPPSKQKAQPIQPIYPTPQKTNYSFKNHLSNDTSFIGKLLTKKGIIFVVIALVVGGIIGIILQALSAKVPILGILGILISALCFLIIPAYVILAIVKYVEYLGKRGEFNKQLANTPEYLQARAEAERVAKAQEAENQKRLDEQYENAMVKYNSTLEVYNNELAEFENKKNIELSILNQDLTENTQALRGLYESTKLIPTTTRELNELIWIYDDMSSSEHDFERALDMLIANKQLANTAAIMGQVREMTHVMYQGFSEVLSGIDYSNYQLEDISNNLGKVRRDINLGNIAAISQRHKTNKNINITNAKLEEMMK